VSDRAEQIRWIRRLVGDETFDAIYTRLGLSPDWNDPIFHLTDLERLVIWMYTTPRDWHRVVNDSLWSSKVTKEVMVFASVLDRALQKLPRVSGTVYRGTFIRERTEEFIRKHKVGTIVTWPGFTSTTRIRRNAYVGNVLFRIESTTGRSLQGYSADDGDEEVLFATGTRYRIVSVIADEAVLALDMVEVLQRTSGS
jgi:NAD:arginine ADP-ribosyltransferase